MKYGYFENNILCTLELQDTDTIPEGVYPVDDLDENMMQTDDGFFCHVTPFLNGERISYEYTIVKDIQAIADKIDMIKAELAESDYKVTKCMEASLIGEEMPYNISELHAERQALRDFINSLEEEITHEADLQ